MQLATSYRGSSRKNCTKSLTASERTIKIKALLRCTFLIILVRSEVKAKQRLLYENDFAQDFLNCKCWDVGTVRFGKA